MLNNKIMEKIAKSLTELIGNTPLLEPVNYIKNTATDHRLLLKLEYFIQSDSA